jgi:tRNA A37 N6-isopentenylltransferase MiaA
MVIDFIKTQKAHLYQSVLQTYPLFHYLHKKNSHLTKKLNKTLKNMQQEGLIDEIRSQFIATKNKEASN